MIGSHRRTWFYVVVFCTLLTAVPPVVVGQWTLTAYPDRKPAKVFATDGVEICAVADSDRALFRSADGGDSWSAILGYDGYESFGISDCTGAAYKDGHILASIDCQFPWRKDSIWVIGDYSIEKRRFVGYDQAALPLSNLKRLAVIGDDLFAITKDSGLYRNGARISIDSGVHISSLTTDGMYLYASSDREGVLRSADSGVHWMVLHTELDQRIVTDCASFGSTLFAASNGLWCSHDSAQHWRKVVEDSSITSVAAGQDRIVAGGRTIYYSADYGVAWQDITANMQPDSIRFVAFTVGQVFVGLGDGIWKRPLSGLLDTKERRSGASTGLSVYYDVFGNSLQLRLPSGQAEAELSIHLYDCLGRPVARMATSVTSALSFAVSLSQFGLRSGVFFAVIEYGQQKQLIRFAVAR